MDQVDVAILREMGRSRVMWWASTDPRLCSETIARAIGVDPTTVRARLRRWATEGFLLGLEVLPNPSILGAVVGGGTLRVDDPRAKARLLRDLSLVDGLILLHDYVGPWLAFSIVGESPAAFERRRRLLAGFPGVDEVHECGIHGTPRAKVTPTPLDWRIMKALRTHARDSLPVGAKAAGVSAKTFAKRYQALVEGDALWLVPIFDFSRYRGAVMARLIVDFARGTDGLRLTQEVRARVPHCVEAQSYDDLGLGFVDRRQVDVVFHCDSPGDAEEAQRLVLDLPGVTGVELLFPRRYTANLHWFDERIDAHLAEARPASR